MAVSKKEVGKDTEGHFEFKKIFCPGNNEGKFISTSNHHYTHNPNKMLK